MWSWPAVRYRERSSRFLRAVASSTSTLLSEHKCRQRGYYFHSNMDYIVQLEMSFFIPNKAVEPARWCQTRLIFDQLTGCSKTMCPSPYLLCGCRPLVSCNNWKNMQFENREFDVKSADHVAMTLSAQQGARRHDVIVCTWRRFSWRWRQRRHSVLGSWTGRRLMSSLYGPSPQTPWWVHHRRLRSGS